MKGGFNIKKTILVITIILILVGLLNTKVEEVIIPKSAIRFRVIANSNKVEDQNIKMKVRDNLQKEVTSLLSGKNSIEESRKVLKDNTLIFQENVSNTLKSLNVKQKVKVSYGENYFPEKIYKGVTYEKGNYESLVVTLGEGKGKNWWCVLFPPLCLLEAEDTEEKEDVEYKFFVKELIDKYFS